MRIGSTSYLAAFAALLISQGAVAAARTDDAAAKILVKARASFGVAHGILRQTGSENASGLTGRWQDIEDTGTGWTRVASDFSLFRVSQVWNATGDWWQDKSGGVHRLNSAFATERATTEMWLAKRGFLQKDMAGANIVYKRSEPADGEPCDVLSATPSGGLPVELWFDRNTGLLARSVWTLPISTATIQYQDYRRIGGLMIPFKVITAEGGQPDIVTFADARIDAGASPTDFAAPTTPDDSTVAGGIATVPIELDGYVVIEAKLNGHGPYAFILDTGGHAIITPEVAKSLNISAVGAGQSGGTGAGTQSVQYADVGRVEIGGVTLRNQLFRVISEPYSALERGLKPALAGIMGLELFERFAMRLDYQHRTLTFRPLAGAPEGHGIPVPIFFSDDIPLFKAKIEGIEGDNALDTGNSGTFGVQWRWADSHGLGDRMRKGYLAAGFGSGGMSRLWVSRLDLNVAGIDFPHTIAYMSSDRSGALSSRTEAGNIGNKIYRNFALDFDYARNMVWFDPQKRLPPPPPPSAGFDAYKNSATAFTIATVAPGTPAAEAGLAPNDDIVSVNGVPASRMSGIEFFEHVIAGVPGTKIALGVERKGQKRMVQIVLRELLPETPASTR